MTKTSRARASLALAATLLCGAVAAPIAASAQTIVDMPTLSFPTKDGVWGCRLTRSCTIGNPAPLERRRVFF